MSKLVSISINVDLLDKSKLYKGKKGTYLNISGFLKEDADNYGYQRCAICPENHGGRR